MMLMATGKTKSIAEYGDFQTPRALAEGVCALLADLGVLPASIVEPTCGIGRFLFASADRWPSSTVVAGFDVNPAHMEIARQGSKTRSDTSRIRVECSDFFKTQWPELLAKLPEPILVIGNPPWVTSAHVSALGGSNVPEKSNFQKHNGLDAITGKANFDISEWMLIKLADALSGRDAVLAMLVKTVVARKLLYHLWRNGRSLSDASLFRIDAAAHFDAAVDASLIVLKFGRTQMPSNRIRTAYASPPPRFHDRIRWWRHRCGSGCIRTHAASLRAFTLEMALRR
jgi:methylase of polypeptide subunit release factors